MKAKIISETDYSMLESRLNEFSKRNQRQRMAAFRHQIRHVLRAEYGNGRASAPLCACFIRRQKECRLISRQ